MNEKVVFEKREVYIHEPPKEEIHGVALEETKIGGRFQIIKNKVGTFIRFLPYGNESNVAEDWAFIVNNSVLTYSKEKDESDSVTMENKSNSTYKIQFDINELSSVRRIYPGYGISSIIFMLNDGHMVPQLHFHKGGSKELLQILKEFVCFNKDTKDPRLWIVQRQDGTAFRQSIYELSLFNEQQNDVVKKFLNEPIQSTLLGFSRITTMVRDVLKPAEQNQLNNSTTNSTTNTDGATASNNSNGLFKNGGGGGGGVFDRNSRFNKKKINYENDDMSELLDSMNAENIHMSNNDGFELVTKVDLGPMPNLTRGPSVGNKDIQFDKDGRILNVTNLKQLIFRGGLEASQRRLLWKFLLNYYDWDSTEESRLKKRESRKKDYDTMKTQWLTISDEQKIKFSLMKERENLIEKDVQRTDRNHSYFIGDTNINMVIMKNILMTYNMYNFDLGYVQGMSDLLAPIMVIMEDEYDSFWCFAGYMNKIESNFLMDQTQIKEQLAYLRVLLDFVDSNFSHYLEKNESSNMYFCFRWILILFKREFTFPDIMHLWEVLWTDLPCKNFHLLICISILLMKKDDIISNKYGFNEILKFINDLSTRINLEKTLEYAEGLYIQLSSFKNLPAAICEILGLPFKEKKYQDDLDLLVDYKLSNSNLASSLANSAQNLNELDKDKTTASNYKIPTSKSTNHVGASATGSGSTSTNQSSSQTR